MTAPSKEAIEAAARAMFDLTPAENLAYATIPRLVDLHEQDRIYYRRLATAALTAAYPLIAAQAKVEALREAALAMDNIAVNTLVTSRSGVSSTWGNAADWLRARAATIENEA